MPLKWKPRRHSVDVEKVRAPSASPTVIIRKYYPQNLILTDWILYRYCTGVLKEGIQRAASLMDPCSGFFLTI